MLHCAPLLVGQIVTLDFDGLPGMANRPAANFPPGDFVASAFRLSDQFLGSHGLLFSSESNADFVAVVNAVPVPSGMNGIGGVTSSYGLDYKVPLDIAFFAPGDRSRPAATDFVSIKGDTAPLGSGTVTFEAFDLSGVVLVTITEVDDHPIVFTFAHPGIHRIRLTQTNGKVAYDDLSFSAPIPIGQPLLAIEVSQVRICWDTRANIMYQPQYRSLMTSDAWVDLGEPVVGSGTINCISEPVTNPRRFYRVVVLP